MNILDRNGANPGLDSDYSLLGKADYIKDQSTADHFEVELYGLISFRYSQTLLQNGLWLRG